MHPMKEWFVHWPHPFHVAFAQEEYNKSITITRRICSSDRCRHLNEVLDDDIVRLSLLRRMQHCPRASLCACLEGEDMWVDRKSALCCMESSTLGVKMASLIP